MGDKSGKFLAQDIGSDHLCSSSVTLYK